MGASFFKSSWKNYIPPNPNPNNFKILNATFKGKYTVALIEYHGCTNFEGRKILVFKGNKLDYLKSIKSLDPHFMTNNDIVARLRPDSDGEAIISLLFKG